MKKILRLICIFIVAFSFFIFMFFFMNPFHLCYEKEVNIMDDHHSQGQVEMHIISSALTRRNAHFRLVNNTNYDVTYGYTFCLESYRRGRWRRVSTNINALSIAYILPPNSYVEISRDFQLTFGRRLSNGNYRIIKDIDLNSDPSETIQVIAEFTICTSTPVK
ncbi:MAG: hypothetical protein FWC91_13175 [Defluviitaleaceae bacterium]|nr:hypothetical protein [Defluviitaleaceae bacterium]